jgi:hypothetical protein
MESRGHAINIEPGSAASVDVSQEQSGLTPLTPLTPATNNIIYGRNEFAHPAETAESRKDVHGLDPAEACLASPICRNRLELCIWKRLRVPKEEKKAALLAEIEKRGDLFAYCLKDAEEYTRRESEA